jgi:hypothetical protein
MPSTVSRRGILGSIAAGSAAIVVPHRTRAASPPGITWSRTYGAGDDRGWLVRDVVETPHGFVLAGVETVGAESLGWVAGVDAGGRRRWERRLGTPTSWFYAGVPGPEDRVFLAGVRNEHQGVTEDGFPDPWVVALEDRDSDASVRWSRTYQPAAAGGTARAIAMRDDRLLLAGSISQDGDGEAAHRPWVAATDTNGTVQWDWRFEDATAGGGLNAVQAAGDALLVGGSVVSGSPGEVGWLGRLSIDGILQWAERIDEHPESRIEDLAPRQQGGVVALGDRGFGSDDDGVGVLVAVDADGTRRWDRSFSTGDWNWLRAVCQVSEGYCLLGTREVADGERRGAWVVRVDEAGRQQWEHLYPPEEYSRGFALHRLAGGGVLIGGDLTSVDDRGRAWLAQVGGTTPERSTSGGTSPSLPSVPSVPSWSISLLAGLGLGAGIERIRRR